MPIGPWPMEPGSTRPRRRAHARGRRLGDRGARRALAGADGGRGRALAEAAARAAPATGPIRVVCGKGNNGGDGLVAARLLARAGPRGRGAPALAARASSRADAEANLERLDGGADRARACRAPDGPRRLRRGRRRDLRDRLRGRAARAGGRRDRGDQRAPAPRSSPPTSPRGSTPRPARPRARRSTRDATVTFHAAKVGHWVAPGQGPAPASCAVAADRDPGRRARRGRRGADRRPASWGSRPRARAGLDQVQLRARCSSSAARAASPGPSAWPPRRRSAPAPGTRRSAVPADLEPIFEVKLTEVMSRGLSAPRGPARRRRRRRDRRGGASAPRPSCSGPGLGRDERLAGARPLRSPSAIEAPLLIDADGLNAYAGELESLAGREGADRADPARGRARPPARARVLGEVAAHRLAQRARGGRASAARWWC